MENIESYWLASTPPTNYPRLNGDITVDVAVLGAGLAGLSVAWFLKQQGLKVALIEANKICQGVSGHTTAKITSQHGLTYAYLDKEFGRERAQQYADANETALQAMAEIIRSQQIDCDYQPKPAFIYTEADQYIVQIEQEVYIARELGLPVSQVPDPGLPFTVKAALRFDNQAQFHPRKYALAIAQTIPGAGSEIYEDTQVVGVEEGTVNTIICANGAKIKAAKVVLTTHFPIHDAHGLYFTRMYAERSYILATKAQVQLPEGMFISAEEPGRSLRTAPSATGELLLVGGEHHRTGVGKEWAHYQALAEFARGTFGATEIPYRWSAQDYTTADRIPYIGHISKGKENIFVATGFRKWGITTSTVAALIIRDLILFGSSPWQDVYSPERGVGLKFAGALAKMNAEVAKELVTGKLAIKAPGLPAVGQARVVGKAGNKTGVYRDEQGKLHAVDITCTHLGCELQWNGAEKTWDCPCHGSRFNPEGEIVSGPALKPLTKKDNDIDPDLI